MATDPREAIGRAIEQVPGVRAVTALHLGAEGDRPLLAARVGLAPALRLPEIGRSLAAVRASIVRLVPPGTVIVLEPEVAADRTTPTEAIVIRAAD